MSQTVNFGPDGQPMQNPQAQSPPPTTPPPPQQPTPPQQPSTPPTNGSAIASLILGIIALITVLLGAFAIGLGILAAVLGLFGLHHAKKHHQKKGMAIAGIILGLCALALAVVIMFFATTFTIEETKSSAEYALLESKANETMTAVEIYKAEHDGEAPPDKGTLLMETDLDSVDSDVRYYRDTSDTTKYRICAPRLGGYVRCETGACGPATTCDSAF